MTFSIRLFLTLLFVLAQAMVAAHASECAEHADHHGDYHHTDECHICHLAERSDDAPAPIQSSYPAPASIAAPPDAFAHHVAAEKNAGSGSPRAPPFPLN